MNGDTHGFLHHPEHEGGVLVVGVANEAAHVVSDERLYLGFIRAVIQEDSCPGHRDQEAEHLRADELK